VILNCLAFGNVIIQPTQPFRKQIVGEVIVVGGNYVPDDWQNNREYNSLPQVNSYLETTGQLQASDSGTT
jgi:hypothetical protein